MESKTIASPEKITIDKRPGRDLPAWAYLILALISLYGLFWIETGEWNIYRLFDNYGWIEHDQDTPVWIKGEWLAGEYRVCQVPLVPEQSLPDSAHLLCGQSEVLMEEDLWPPDFIRGFEFARLNWPTSLI